MPTFPATTTTPVASADAAVKPSLAEQLIALAATPNRTKLFSSYVIEIPVSCDSDVDRGLAYCRRSATR